jgi:hypothetical protein
LITFPLARIREIADIFSAAVLVWIVGGGYSMGTKSSSGNPAGILASSIENIGEGVIFVQINYRLGLFVCYPLFFNFGIFYSELIREHSYRFRGLSKLNSYLLGLVVRPVFSRSR